MKKNKTDHPLLFKVVMLAAGLLAGFICARLFFTVMTAGAQSMEPAIMKGEKILISKFASAGKGDITAIENPSDDGALLLLRIIAGENDTVEIRNRIIYINDARFNPSWQIKKTDSSELPMKFCNRDNMPPVRLGRNEVFLLGDNFDNSYDSRMFGKTSTRALKGKVIWKHKF